MIRFLLFFLLSLTTVHSIAANNIAKFYEPHDWSESDKKYFQYSKSTEKIHIVESDDFEDYSNSMLANGYVELGRSSFKDRDLPKSEFISQAKKLGAIEVFLYKENASTVSYYFDDDPNNLDYIYDYVAIFYVKDNFLKKPNMLGINHGKIPVDKRKAYQRNTGAYVANVVTGTRAYNANVVLEDVVIEVNGKKVIIPEDLNKIKDSELKKTKILNLTIIRLINNEPREIQIPVDFN